MDFIFIANCGYDKIIGEGVESMQDKIFELIEKIYSEFSKKFENVDRRLDNLTEEMRKNREFIVNLENKLDEKINALFDGYKQNTEAIYKLEGKFDELAGKVEKQEVEIRVIKGAK